MSDTRKLIESFQQNLKESVDLPEGYETFTDFEVGKNYDPSQSACKLNAMKAYIDDNSEDVYVGSVKVNGEEILHFFNVNNGKVIDHSGTANTEGNEMSEYKGVNISGPLKAKGYTPYTQKIQDASFQNEKGDIIKVVGGGTKPRFFFNDEEISYEDLKNINESEDCIKEDEEVVDELTEFKTKVQEAGGLYGYVSNNYTSMSQELLKEIALNALYELNNDEVVIKDVTERYFNESEELKEDWEPENLELDDNGLPALEKPYQMKWSDEKECYYIDSIRPYNLTDYSWAKSEEADLTGKWNVYGPDNKLVNIVDNYEEAVKLMKDIDSKLEARIDRT